jgi:aminoglycoside 3-N-acetyltransferase
MLSEYIKALIKKLNSIPKNWRYKRTVPRITKDMIINDLLKLGVKKGDNVLIHSSLKRIGFVQGGAKTVIDALLEVVSSSGTLVVPTYSGKGTMYKTCMAKDYIFDPKCSGTGLGAIPSTFMKLHNEFRSIHPTHSISAAGKDAKFITEAHHIASSTYGTDSPWDRLLKLDGKILGLGVTLAPIAFFHVLEDRMLVKFPLPVRMKETYFLKCKDWKGNFIEVPVTPLDPKYAAIRIDHTSREDLRNYFWRDFNQSGILNVGMIGMATSWYASAKCFYEHLAFLLEEGITIYSTPDELQRRPV